VASHKSPFASVVLILQKSGLPRVTYEIYWFLTIESGTRYIALWIKCVLEEHRFSRMTVRKSRMRKRPRTGFWALCEIEWLFILAQYSTFIAESRVI
jgi:hypothetical protein